MRRAFSAIGVVLLAGGCASAPAGQAAGKYPAWLIAAAEPVAPAVGFTISHVQWRRGYLKSREEALAAIAAQLRPLDILIFSSKGRLSGHTGSGLFGHSAIYLGSERELAAIGLKGDPHVVPHLQAIRDGRLIIESAQRGGTDLSALDDVADTDRIAVLRPRGISPQARRAAISAAFDRVGGRFDHRFRLDETEKLFCTELIDQVLPQLALPRHEAYGREIILPDDLGLMAVRGSRLSFVMAVTGAKQGWKLIGPAELRADIYAAGG